MNGETTVSAAAQLSVVLTAVASGMIMGLYYDLFRIIRKTVRCGKVAVTIQDMFFWITSAAAIFYQSIVLNGGYVRVLFVITVLISWVLYLMTVGKLTMFMVNSVLKLLKSLFYMVYKRIISPISAVVNKFFMLISQKITEILTHMTKNTKMNKKC